MDRMDFLLACSRLGKLLKIREIADDTMGFTVIDNDDLRNAYGALISAIEGTIATEAKRVGVPERIFPLEPSPD